MTSYAFLLSVAPPTAAYAEQMTVKDLQGLCSNTGDACRFYVLGAMEGASLAAGVVNDKAHFCVPEGVTQTEIVAVVKRLVAADLAQFPEDSRMPAISFIGAVLMKTYPCKSG
jgi:hypothetical protein